MSSTARTALLAGACALSAALLLASCSSDESSRSAAGIDETDGGVSVGGSGIAPTRICVVNKSGTSIDVTFTRKDRSTRDGTVSSGGEACGEGSFFSNDDVNGTIRAGQWSRSYSFGAVNKSYSLPSAFIHADNGNCPENRSDYFENSSSNNGDGVLRFSLKRLADPKGQNSEGGSYSLYKDFRITVTDESGRTADTVPSTCW